MIRTGNPHFADIRVHNATKTYNASCFGNLTAEAGEIPHDDVEACGKGMYTTLMLGTNHLEKSHITCASQN